MLRSLKKYIPKEECKLGFVYRICSRNLAYGVYTGHEKGGFVGVREKFDSLFLFEEYHWDNGPPFGTVKPIEEVCELPEGMSPHEYKYLYIENPETGEKIEIERVHDQSRSPTEEDPRHYFYDVYKESGEEIPYLLWKKSKVRYADNKELFDFLEKLPKYDFEDYYEMCEDEKMKEFGRRRKEIKKKDEQQRQEEK